FPPRTFDEAPKGGHHIPVATLGILGYALIAVLALMGRWWLVFEAAQVGFLFAAFLSYLEAYVLEKWCIYCLWSQGIVTTILVVTIAALVMRWRASKQLAEVGR
ncbi:MAG TPA: vitamin K epoxide reductase family protein, partial [Edaphobacter sp.]|nr:vitamin K epoxide reductase family protein [Edaphobacter sp.]